MTTDTANTASAAPAPAPVAALDHPVDTGVQNLAVVAKPRKVSTFGRRSCPECGETFTARHHAARFCSPAHQRQFHNRSMGRGKVAMPYLMAWRGTKSLKATTAASRGSAVDKVKRERDRAMGKFAFGNLCALADQFNREDREAGRPSMVAYVRTLMLTDHPGEGARWSKAMAAARAEDAAKVTA